MQGEVHAIAALPPCTSVLEARLQQTASFNTVFPTLSFSAGDLLTSTSSRTAPRLKTPMATIASEAVAASVHSQDSVLDFPASSSELVVVGHRGCGKNKTGVSETRLSIRENTITSFNLAARNGAQFVEFDVQVTKDGVPVIFHDDVIITDAAQPGKLIGDLTLEQFRAIGPQTDATEVGQSLYRRGVDGSVGVWTVDVEGPMCTLAEAFAEVQPSVGFNIEVKFDDDGETSEEELQRVIDAVVEDVGRFAKERPIYFSSFHPDAVQILRRELRSEYPVLFLTDGGSHLYTDPRRNSIEAAVQVCRAGDLQGIVSEVKAVLQSPASVALVKAEGLLFFTYGELNNVGEAVLMQQSWGIDGVIVDHVLEMVRVARHMDELPDSPSSASLPRRSVSVV